MACYADVEGVLGLDYNTYPLYNKVGFFNYFNGTDTILTHNAIRSNTSGKYEIFVNLPEGYGFDYIVTDGGLSNEYDSNEFFVVNASIVARTIKIHIRLIKIDSHSEDWGVQGFDSPLYK